MTDTDAVLKSSSKKEKADLARWALTHKAAKKAQNARARANKKASGDVRFEKWVPRAQVDEVRHLLSLYADARKSGEALWIRIAPPVDEQGSGLIVEGSVGLPGRQPVVLPGQGERSQVLRGAASLRDLFHTPGYTAELQSVIAEIVNAEGPLPRDVLELKIAKRHGYAATGTAIRARIAACLDGVELHREIQVDGKERSFVWAPGSFGLRAPWRGRCGRDLADISAREWADFLDKHGNHLEKAEKPVREAARMVGVQALTESTGKLLTAYRNWWLANPVVVDHRDELPAPVDWHGAKDNT